MPGPRRMPKCTARSNSNVRRARPPPKTRPHEGDMSFLNKIKGWGPKDGAATEAAADPVPPGQAMGAGELHAGFGQPTADAAQASPHDVPTVQHAADFDTSIISEAAPSGMAEFAETHVPAIDAMA